MMTSYADHASAMSVAAAPGAPAFASVEVVEGGLAGAAEAWRSIAANAVVTPYQNRAFLAAWSDNVIAHEHAAPMVVVAREADGRPVALLPFSKRRRFGIAIAGFLGGTHVNYNLPLMRRDRLSRFTHAETHRLLRETARKGGIDIFVLSNQPLQWDGVANPFVALPRQPSPDAGYSGPLAETLDDHLTTFMSAKTRSAQRRKMRRFEEQGAPRLYRAENDADRSRILEAYFAQKAQRLAQRGIDSVFEKPGVHEFVAAAAGLGGRTPAIDLYGFDLDGRTIATFGSITDGTRLCGMFNSITSCDMSRYSPGELLLNFMVEDAIRRGMRTFDLGVGAAPYKTTLCPNVEPLFDSIFGVTQLGRAAALGLAGKTAAKARIKANPKAYGMVEKVRKLRAGSLSRSAAAASDAAVPEG